MDVGEKLQLFSPINQELTMNQFITSAQLRAKALRLVTLLKENHFTVSTAESCTGGLIAKTLTDIPGSSACVAGGFVTYTNEIKIGVLGVDASVIAEYTEVSEACAQAMAECAQARMNTTFALSATGFAGPDGGTKEDPVGTVYLGIADSNGASAKRIEAPIGASRAQVRTFAAFCALELLERKIEEVEE